MMFVAHFLYLCLTHLPPSPKKTSAKRCETKKKFFFCKNYGTTSRLPLLFWFALLYYERRGTQKGKEKRPRRGQQNLKWAGNLNSAPRLSFFVCKNAKLYVRKTMGRLRDFLLFLLALLSYKYCLEKFLPGK